MADKSISSILRRDTGIPEGASPGTGQPAMAPLQGQQLPRNGAGLAQGGDNIPAQITDQQGKPQGPAAIKAGEIVFSVESIIGAGNGDYAKGAKLLLGLHDKLQDHGDAINQKQSLAGAKTGPGGPSQQEMPPQGLAAPQPQQGPSQGLAGAIPPVQ